MHLIDTARNSIAINLPKPTECSAPQNVSLGDRGRPRYFIPREQIEFLLEWCLSDIRVTRLEVLDELDKSTAAALGATNTR